MHTAHALQSSLAAARPALLDGAAQPTSKERRERSRARRRAMLDLSRQIFDLHDKGATCDEIAKVVERNPRTVRAHAAMRGILIDEPARPRATRLRSRSRAGKRSRSSPLSMARAQPRRWRIWSRSRGAITR